MAQLAEGLRKATALTASDAPTALSEYTQALLKHPNSLDNYILRSTAFTRLKPPRYDLALKDAEYAVAIGFKRAVREKIQVAQQRRVVALNGLGRYADAKYLLTTMRPWIPKKDNQENKSARMEIDMWMARVDLKLKHVPDSEKVVTVKECPEVQVLSEDEMRSQLKAQLKEDGSYKLDEEADVKPTSTPTTNGTTGTVSDQNAASANTHTDATKPNASTTNVPVPQIRHEWYQNAQSVTITLYAKGVSKDAAEVEMKEDSIYISFPHPANPSSTFSFSLDPLFALIDPSQSKFSIMSTKIELTLRKVQQGQKWHNLEGTTPLKAAAAATQADEATVKDAILSTVTASEPTASATVSVSTAPPTYPTSSRHGPKDWDKLANELHARTKPKKKNKTKTDKAGSKTDADKAASSPPSSGDEAGGEDVDSDYESGDAVDSFFKKLYAGADPDTRRAMMKSFYESNGTALSTNWSEVGKAPVEEVKGKD